MTSFYPQIQHTSVEISPLPDSEYLGIDIEPECLINLFREPGDNLFDAVSEQETVTDRESDSEMED
jgi:hypothetical protein